MSTESIAYFKQAVMKYIRGDIKELLRNKVHVAGPLLCVTVNGIDLMGGICYGFTRGSSKRSQSFMSNHMKIDGKVAKLLYKCVRCGVAHQGMPKVGVKFFLMTERFQPGVILYKSKDNLIYLNVTEFACSYLDAIEHIDKSALSAVLYYPPIDASDESAYLDAILAIKEDIDDLCQEVAASDRAEEESRLARHEIESMSSLSAYLPDNTLNISLSV